MTDSARLKKNPKASRGEKTLFLREEGAALAWRSEVMVANIVRGEGRGGWERWSRVVRLSGVAGVDA